MNIGCVIMAAGRGQRFGGNKLLAPLAGRPVLLHVLDALPREKLARLAAVTGSPDVAELCRGAGISAQRNVSGLLSESVRLGVEAMDGMDGCLFVMGDQPLCTAASMGRMLAAFSDAPTCVFRLCHRGQAGSPVLFPQTLFPALKALTGQQGGMAAAGAQQTDVRLVRADSAFELWDIDTKQALQQVEAQLLARAGAYRMGPYRPF